MTMLRLSGDPEADRLLSTDPLALLIGMVLDQQVPLEWAFAGPAELRRRLGRDLDTKEIASMDPEVLAGLFSAKPALHRYPGSMAGRVQDLCRTIVADYGGKPDGIWEGVGSGTELLDRVRRLPGFGEQKAKIFVALLGKQLGVRPDGWRESSSPYGDPDTFRSVADITDAGSLDRVRAFKQEMKAKNKAAAAATPVAGKTTRARKQEPARQLGATGKAPVKKAQAKTVAVKKAPVKKASTTKLSRGKTPAGKEPAGKARAARKRATASAGQR